MPRWSRKTHSRPAPKEIVLSTALDELNDADYLFEQAPLQDEKEELDQPDAHFAQIGHLRPGDFAAAVMTRQKVVRTWQDLADLEVANLRELWLNSDMRHWDRAVKSDMKPTQSTDGQPRDDHVLDPPDPLRPTEEPVALFVFRPHRVVFLLSCAHLLTPSRPHALSVLKYTPSWAAMTLPPSIQKPGSWQLGPFHQRHGRHLVSE